VSLCFGVVGSADGEEGVLDGPASAVGKVAGDVRLEAADAGVELPGALNMAAHEDGLGFGAAGCGTGAASFGASASAFGAEVSIDWVV